MRQFWRSIQSVTIYHPYAKQFLWISNSSLPSLYYSVVQLDTMDVNCTKRILSPRYILVNKQYW